MTKKRTKSVFWAIAAVASILSAHVILSASSARAEEETKGSSSGQETSAQDGASARGTQESSSDGAVSDGDLPANPATFKAIDLYVDGDFEGAYAALKEVYDADPNSDPPGVLLALLHSHAERYVEMRRALEQSAEEYPSDPEAYLQLAGVDVQEGRYLETELLLERADSLIDDYGRDRENAEERRNYFREEALNVRAILAEKRGRYDAAIALVKKALTLNPENPQSYWNLGYLAMKTKDYDAAEQAYDDAAKRNPGLWAGWLQVVSGMEREDKIEEAKERLKGKEKEIASATKKERAQLARLYMRFDMFEAASEIIREFEKENAAKDAERWILSGWLALYANKYAAAEEFFRNAVVIEPNNFEASNGLALALLDQRSREKLNQARAIATRNYRENPDSTEAATTYAWTLFLTGNTKESDAIFQPMLNSGEIAPTAAYYLAEIANARDDLGLAESLLHLALSKKGMFPKRTAANELLRIVEKKLAPPEDPVMKDFDEDVDFGGDEDESTFEIFDENAKTVGKEEAKPEEKK